MALFLLLTTILHGCRSPDEENIEGIFTELDQCPRITTSSWRDPVVTGQILARMDAIRQYPLEDIREAVARATRVHFLRESPLFKNKLWILNRYLFNVPEKYPRARARFFFFGLPRPDDNQDYVNLMWPLGYTEDGRITLVGWYWFYKRGFMEKAMGASYDAVGEFDYFRSTFGLRALNP